METKQPEAEQQARQKAKKVLLRKPFAVDELMLKPLFMSGADAFRADLMHPIGSLKQKELLSVGIRLVIPSTSSRPDGKHFIIRTCCNKCYRVTHEGLGAHMWSTHLFENAEDDAHALQEISKAEAKMLSESLIAA